MTDLPYDEHKKRENQYKADQAVRGVRSAVANLAEQVSDPEVRKYILGDYVAVGESERELFLISHYLRGHLPAQVA